MITQNKPKTIFICERCNEQFKTYKTAIAHAKLKKHYEFRDINNQYMRLMVI